MDQSGGLTDSFKHTALVAKKKTRFISSVGANSLGAECHRQTKESTEKQTCVLLVFVFS